MAQLLRYAPRLISGQLVICPGVLAVQSMRFMSSRVSTTTPPEPVVKEPWRKDFDPALEDQSFAHEGRSIGFAEYGTRTGTPTFLFHGSPGSRYDGIVYHDSAKKLDVRIICPDRPGHGLSTFVPDRKLVDYPADVSALAKHLKLGPYHVFGQSGGGPYAVACARFLSSDELLNTGVVAGMGPPELITLRDAGWYSVIAFWLNINASGLMKRISDYFVPKETIQNDEKLQKTIDRYVKWLPKAAREELTDIDKPEAQRELRAHLQAMFAQGWDGTFRDAQVLGSPWGFKLEDVAKNVVLIYGAKDVRTPTAFGRHYRDHLQDATLIEWEECGHLTISDRADEILARITGKEDLWKSIQKGEANSTSREHEGVGRTSEARHQKSVDSPPG